MYTRGIFIDINDFVMQRNIEMTNSLKDSYKKVYRESIVDRDNPDYKNTDKGTAHSYIDYYQNLFLETSNPRILGKNPRILEIGVQGGISLLMWKDYFSDSDIVGIDIDISQVQEKVMRIAANPSFKINLIEGDAADSTILEKITGKFDIIIDDGSHLLHHQLSSFNLLKDHLNSGGIYIIEDVGSELNARILNQTMGSNSQIVDLRSVKGRWDDLILVYRKRGGS